MLESRLKLLFFASILALLIAIIMTTYGIPRIIGQQIQKNIQLDNSSAVYDKWEKLPIPLHFKVYLFNVTNPEEVTQGAKPKMAEIGPYVYDQYREKTVTGYGENDTIIYTLKKTFTFNAEKSGILMEDDRVTVINLSYMALLLKVEELMPSMVSMANDAMGLFFPNLIDPFLRTRVGDLLFDGIFLNCSAEDTALRIVCGRLRQQAPPTLRQSENGDGFYFSMFAHLNLTESGPYKVVRGREDVQELGHIVEYDGQTSMGVWGDPYCGQLNGTDSSIFPPIDESNVPLRLYTFEPQVCRSLYADFVERTTLFNMTAYYFEVSRLALASKSAVPTNKCFCKKNWSANHDGCLMMGLLDLSPCQRVPVVASLPHFYLASEELLYYFAEGVQPDREKHNSYVYLEPTTGAVLKGTRRLQFNIELRNLKSARQLQNVSTGLFPLLWVDEGAEIDSSIQQLLHSSHVRLGYAHAVRWVLIAVALACAVCAGAVLARRTAAVGPWRLPQLWRRSHSVNIAMRAPAAKNYAFQDDKAN